MRFNLPIPKIVETEIFIFNLQNCFLEDKIPTSTEYNIQAISIYNDQFTMHLYVSME